MNAEQVVAPTPRLLRAIRKTIKAEKLKPDNAKTTKDREAIVEIIGNKIIEKDNTLDDLEQRVLKAMIMLTMYPEEVNKL